MRPSHSFFVAHHSELVAPPVDDDVDPVVADREAVRVGERAVHYSDAVDSGSEVVVEREGVPGEAAARTQRRRHSLEEATARPPRWARAAAPERGR